MAELECIIIAGAAMVEFVSDCCLAVAGAVANFVAVKDGVATAALPAIYFDDWVPPVGSNCTH